MFLSKERLLFSKGEFLRIKGLPLRQPGDCTFFQLQLTAGEALTCTLTYIQDNERRSL